MTRSMKLAAALLAASLPLNDLRRPIVETRHAVPYFKISSKLL